MEKTRFTPLRSVVPLLLAGLALALFAVAAGEEAPLPREVGEPARPAADTARRGALGL